MKYGNVTLGQMEAAINKMGGIEVFQALLRGSAVVTVVKHIVNLAASPKLPFDGAEVVKHIANIGGGKKEVELELRSDDNLYVDGLKIVLTQSRRQLNGEVVEGHELRQELENGEQVLLNSNILDYLYEHPELFPERWKQDEKGNTRFIYFWGSIFRDPSHGSLRVRDLYWHNGGLRQSHNWLGDSWYDQDWSASLASI